MAMTIFELQAIIGADLGPLKKGFEDANNMASSAGGKLSSALSSAAKVGLAAVGAAATAMAGFAATSVATGAEFDKSMSQVAATMGTTVDQIDNLRNFAQEMGRTTAFSATQAADALNYMALAGYNADQSMEMLPNVLNLAAAGDMELARASDMVTDAQSALGLKMEDMTGFVDQLAKTASKSNTSVSQLGEAILTIGGTAKTLSGGTTELNTALGILADNGIKGAEGGTKLRNVVLSLSAPTDKAADVLKELGIVTKDAQGNMLPLDNLMGQLSKSLDGLGTADKAAIIKQIFNKQDIAAVNALLDTSADRWDELSAAIDDSTGAADAMAKTQLDNLAGDITLFKSALEGAQIAISDSLSPALREFVQFGTDGLSKITSAFQEGGLEGAMEAFGEILSDGLAMIIEKLPEFIDAGMKLLGALGQGILDNLPLIISSAVKVIQQLVPAFVKALPEIVKAGMQIAIGLVNGIASMLPTLIPQIVQALVDMAMAIVDNLPALMDGLIALVEGLTQGLIDAIPILLDRLPEMIQKIVDALVNNLPLLLQGVIQLILGLADGLLTAIPILIDQLPVIIEGVVKALIACLPQLIVGVIQLVTMLCEHLPEIIVALIEAIPQIAMAIIDAFMQTDWLGLGANIIMAILNGILAFVSVIPNELVMIGQDAIDWVTNMDWLGLGSNLITWIVNGVKNLILELPKTLMNIGQNAVNYIKNIKWVQVGIDIINGIVQGVKDMAGKFIDAIVDLCTDAWDEVKDFFGIESPSKLMRYAGHMIDEGLASGIEKYSDLPVRAMESMSASISGVPQVAFAGAGGYGSYNGAYGQEFNQTVNIYAPEALTPSEVARQTRNATRDMVLELRGRR